MLKMSESGDNSIFACSCALVLKETRDFTQQDSIVFLSAKWIRYYSLNLVYRNDVPPETRCSTAVRNSAPLNVYLSSRTILYSLANLQRL